MFKFDSKGKFAPKYTPEDMVKFIRWVKMERDINECIGQIMMEYKVSPMTGFNWMQLAAKKAKDDPNQAIKE